MHTLCGHSGERTAQSLWRRRTTIVNNDQTRSPPPLIFCATRKTDIRDFGSKVIWFYVLTFAQWWRWMRQRQLGSGRQRGSRVAAAVAAERWQWRQHGNSGGRAATAVAARRRWRQPAGARRQWQQRSDGGISMAEAWRWQAAWQWGLQRSVSGSSTVAVSAEWRRQHGSGAEMAGSRWQ
jgi:hypothetical protein